METKEAQCLFSKYIKGDSLLQLKNGKIIFYYFRKYFFHLCYIMRRHLIKFMIYIYLK